MKTAGMLFVIAIIPVVLCQSPPEKPNAKEILKEFFSSNPSNERLLTVLEKGAKEPYKTELIKRVIAQNPTPEEASRLLAQNPPEPYAQEAWKIVESKGTLRNKCYVLSRGSQEYQDKAFASIHEQNLIIEEYAFYLMGEEVPQRFVQSIWDGFSKLLNLNPAKAKENILFAANNAKGDFQEIAILYSLTQKLTASELDSVLNLISETKERKAKKREEKLTEIMTRK